MKVLSILMIPLPPERENDGVVTMERYDFCPFAPQIDRLLARSVARAGKIVGSSDGRGGDFGPSLVTMVTDGRAGVTVEMDGAAARAARPGSNDRLLRGFRGRLGRSPYAVLVYHRNVQVCVGPFVIECVDSAGSDSAPPDVSVVEYRRIGRSSLTSWQLQICRDGRRRAARDADLEAVGGFLGRLADALDEFDGRVSPPWGQASEWPEE